MDLHDEHAESLPENTLEAWAARDVVIEAGEAIACSLAGRAFIALADRLHARPWERVRSVRLVAVQPFMLELAACPHLAQLQTLNLHGNRIGDSGAVALAASPHLVHLRHLDLSTNDLTDEGLAALRAAPWFLQLESLDLSGNLATPVTLRCAA